MNICSWWVGNRKWENRSCHRKTCHSVTLSMADPAWMTLGLNPDFSYDTLKELISGGSHFFITVCLHCVYPKLLVYESVHIGNHWLYIRYKQVWFIGLLSFELLFFHLKYRSLYASLALLPFYWCNVNKMAGLSDLNHAIQRWIDW
jgi:hypothetical protein